MPKLPGGLGSWQAMEIKGMIAEGRAEEAMHKLAALLEAGNADAAVQTLSAKWIMTIGIRPGDAKALRGGRHALRDEWIEIAEMVRDQQDGGVTYAEAVRVTAEHFGYSERHVQSCVADYSSASDPE